MFQRVVYPSTPAVHGLLVGILLSLFFSLAPSLGAGQEFSAPAEHLCALRPDLEKALSDYRELAQIGPWPLIPEGPTLRENDHDPRVSLLRRRLAASRELGEAAAEGVVFNPSLAAAVRAFQARHGLAVDGAVGPATRAALNVPLSHRIRQIEVNLARCQPLPDTLESRHIFVNIADFSLQVIEHGFVALNMPVIVGKTYRQTPVLSSTVSTVVVNPTWEVPHSIASTDILERVLKEPDYLKKNKFQIFRGWDRDSKAIDPKSIAWHTLSSGHFPYRFRQEPGSLNALGRLKFLFPNEHDVYLHDTPARELFHRTSRTFSSGCIRVAKPLELAVHLLQGTAMGNQEALIELIASGKTKWLPLARPIAIHVVYMTAWVDSQGILQFRSDIYGRDKAPVN